MPAENKNRICPTAIVSGCAKIGKNVTIGSYSVVQDDVVIGDNCEIMSHVVIENGTRLGKNSTVYHHAMLGSAPQDRKHEGSPTELIIGENCIIREGVTMHRGSDTSIGKTVIGNNCMFLAYSHVAHDCIIGNNVTMSNNSMLGGHVELGDFVNIGGGGAVHQFVRVGHHAFVGGLAALVTDLIPYGSAIGVHAYFAGLNVIGMKRSKMKRSDIHALRRAVKMLFDRTKPLFERSLDIRQAFQDFEVVQDLANFILSDHKRSFCTPKI